jgi:hypothetical protein
VQHAFLEGVEDFVIQVDGNIEANTFASTSTLCGDKLAWAHDNEELNGALVTLAPPCHIPADWWRTWEGRKAVWDCKWTTPKENVLQNFTTGTKTLIPLRRLLAAAGVKSLEEISDTNTTKLGRNTYRHEGAKFQSRQ